MHSSEQIIFQSYRSIRYTSNSSNSSSSSSSSSNNNPRSIAEYSTS